MSKKTDSEKREGKSFRGRLLTLFIFALIVVAVGLALFFRFLSVYIGPGEFGIK